MNLHEQTYTYIFIAPEAKLCLAMLSESTANIASNSAIVTCVTNAYEIISDVYVMLS